MEDFGILVGLEGIEQSLVRRAYFTTTNATIVYGDLPEGVRSNFVNPQSRAKQLVIVNALGLALSLMLIFARLWSKFRVTHNVGWDDCMWRFDDLHA